MINPAELSQKREFNRKCSATYRFYNEYLKGKNQLQLSVNLLSFVAKNFFAIQNYLKATGEG